MEVDTDRQSADAHLDDDPLMQAALADDSISTDRDTKPENQPGSRTAIRGCGSRAGQ
jgi:hypothetical protein